MRVLVPQAHVAECWQWTHGRSGMSKAFDLRELLDSWPYDEEDHARIVELEEGRKVMQVRTPMGLEQYELEGRPDGHRPYDSVSVLDYHRAQLQEAALAGGVDEFELDEEECAELFQEGTLYYFRYLHLFQLREWALVAEDTERNLGLFDFVHLYAGREEDREHLEKWRPYLVRMNAVARAMLAAEDDNLDEALEVLRGAIENIEGLDELDEETFMFERDRSLSALRELEEQLSQVRPIPEEERLEIELQRAIETQEFERAAVLRDRLKAMRAED